MSAAAVMRRFNRRSARGTSSVAFFTNVLAGLMVLRGSISRHACLASVLLDARSFIFGAQPRPRILARRPSSARPRLPCEDLGQGKEPSHQAMPYTDWQLAQLPQIDPAIVRAAVNGDVAAVRQWLDDGNDPNLRYNVIGNGDVVIVGSGETLLHETPPAFTRLIGGSAPASRPKTRAAKVLSSPGLPDPLAHLVCKFWLGEPPRRRTE